jgi:DNA polymerase III delta subunit
MLYVFHGSNIEKAKDKSSTLIKSLQTKRPDALFVKIDSDNWDDVLIEENLSGQGLFSSKYIILLDRLSENSEAKEKILGFISAMQESPNIFIVLEGKLLAEPKKVYEKYAEKMVICDELDTNTLSKKKDFNVFALGDAFGARDNIKAWTLYRQAIDSGIEPENIVGTLFWQVKSIILAAGAKNTGESGLNPFVYNNCKRFAKNHSLPELRNFLRKLIVTYHDGHRDMEIGVEKLLLMKYS